MNFAADTNPLRSAEYRVKFCSLCRTANHLLSRECFNCGWRGEFSSDSSGSPANPLWSEGRASCQCPKSAFTVEIVEDAMESFGELAVLHRQTPLW